MANKLGWGLDSWGTGEGQSLSVFDHLVGKPIIHQLFHGQSYENKYKELGQSLATQHGASQAALYKALQAIGRGYGGAENALQMGGSIATKAILDREKQNVASGQQSMIARGLYDSTAQDANARGIAADTNDSLAGLQAQLAQLGSNIKIGQAHDTASAYGNIAQNEQQYLQDLLELGLNTQYGEQGGMGGLLGGIFGKLSDRRLKTNIDLIGVADGIPIYEFDYKDIAAMPGRYRGVMADDLLEIRPDAVSRGDDGYLRVDYQKLGFELRRVS